jgi:Cu2+-exporting ATPase
MDVPIALGVAVAFIASVWATFTGGADVYFDSISMFVFFLLSARFLELRARQKAAANLEHLDKALPALAHRLRAFPALDTEDVPAVSLAPTDLVLVRPGEAFPADGVVLHGESACDEALLTGESRPVSKSAGSTVIAGAINRVSPLAVKVERVGEETRASGIRRLVERAASQRPALVETNDRIAGWLVAGVLLAALGAAGWWLQHEPTRALWIAVSVLVVTCPCALSLATPAALTVGVGRLARRGVIVTRAQAIETLSKVTHVVFDKTGTLTQGHLAHVRTMTFGTQTREVCLALADALEQGSEHPIAAALQAASRGHPSLPQARALRNVPGAGVEALVNGVRIRIGTSAFVGDLVGRAAPQAPSADAGGSQVWLGSEREWLACFELTDALRPEAAPVVRALRRVGKRVLIMSGDSEPAVRDAARRLGIERFEAGLTPERKHALVQALQAKGAVVAMVGDGVNDAPVLAQAQVSIAMGSGALLSQAHSDIVLLAGLHALPTAFGIAGNTWQVIRENLAWAVAYNVLAIPAAIAGWVSPWIAGAGMGASSLIVVLNALRLLRCEPTTPASQEAAGMRLDPLTSDS